jgi:O-antigen/teichoic acid export membrane protein
MASRALRRRSATAVGVYAATVLGVATTIVATRILGTARYAEFAIVFASVGFVQMLLDLTVDEALVKYGFRYTTAEDWGRLRRLFEVALGFKLVGAAVAFVVLAALAAFSQAIWGPGLAGPLLVGSLIPLAQAAEGIGGIALILRDSYHVRAWFYTVSMGTRLAGAALGALHGVLGAILGMLIGQVVATAAISFVGYRAFRAFPTAPRASLGADRAELLSFVVTSTIASSLTSGRAMLGTMLIGAVSPRLQAGYFRNAQAPLTAFGALSSPARLMMLAEQTADYERGHRDRVRRLLRRYVIGSTALMLVVVPVGWVLMPWAMGVAYGYDFRLHATDAGRIVLFVGALQLVFGFSKTLPVSIGRPGLRVVSHAIEVAVFVPLLVVFGSLWGATGGALALLVSTVAFCIAWVVILFRLRDALANVDPNVAVV